MITINPTIQERGERAADQYWHEILRSYKLRIAYGLQNPKNGTKALVQTYTNNVTECMPNYRGINGSTTIYHNSQEYIANIEKGAVILYYLNHNYNVARAPEKWTKAKKEKFCKAVVKTLMDDPGNILDIICRAPGQIATPMFSTVDISIPDEVPA